MQENDGQQTTRYDFLANFLKSLINALIRFFGVIIVIIVIN
jgi:hypothetical protein